MPTVPVAPFAEWALVRWWPMIMPGVLQWHVPSKLFMWQKPKGYLSTWTWRNMCQASTRKYQVLGHPCCRTGQILGWLGDIRNCAYSWRCTEKVGKVKGTIIKHVYIYIYSKGRRGRWISQVIQPCRIFWQVAVVRLTTSMVLLQLKLWRSVFALLWTKRCHHWCEHSKGMLAKDAVWVDVPWQLPPFVNTMCNKRRTKMWVGQFQLMSGEMKLYHCTWKICLWLWRRTLKEAKCEVEPGTSWTLACQLRTSHPTQRSTFTLPRVSTMGGALACEVNGKSILSVLPKLKMDLTFHFKKAVTLCNC